MVAVSPAIEEERIIHEYINTKLIELEMLALSSDLTLGAYHIHFRVSIK